MCRSVRDICGTLSLALLVSAPGAAAQDQTPIFVEAGVGVATAGDAAPAAYAAVGAGHWKVRGTTAVEFEIFSDSDTRWDVGVLRSWYGAWSAGYTSFGAGLAVTGGEVQSRRGSNEDPGYLTVGIPVEISAVLAGAAVGIGLGAFVDVNPEATYGGVALTLHLGRLPAPDVGRYRPASRSTRPGS